MTNKSRQFLKKAEIIRSSKEIAELFKAGERVFLPGVTIYLRQADHTRACFIIKKDTGNAVTRNRYKRWLREIYRQNKGWFKDRDVMFYINAKNRPVKPGYNHYYQILKAHFNPDKR